ncbi:heme-dependent oxidative N-demethylase family protein [Sphingomonas sp.]
MSLGFSVEALVPRARGGGALRMGLVRLTDDEWLQPDFDREARVAAFDCWPESVVVLPEGEAAGREAAALVGVAGGLGEAARSVWEDLCVLMPASDGRYRLVGGAVAFPTDWRLADKLGRELTQVHAPIHGYAEQLASGVDHFMATMPAGAIFGRANWFVVASGEPRWMPEDDPADRFAHVTPDNAGQTLFVRCERQTLRRLPETGAVLFTIGIGAAPLDELSSGVVARVANAVAAIGAGEHERRAAPHYAVALAAYAARRATETEIAA